jgi:hypothetical protein
MFQFNIVFGILIAFLSNSLPGGIGQNAWCLMPGVGAFPALVFALFCIGLPESPRWTIIHNNEREGGLNVLRKINSDFTDSEVVGLVSDIEASGDEKLLSGIFFSRRLLLCPS